jgi:alpha-tubulin suppressor-like RCC1 family protein
MHSSTVIRRHAMLLPPGLLVLLACLSCSDDFSDCATTRSCASGGSAGTDGGAGMSGSGGTSPDGGGGSSGADGGLVTLGEACSDSAECESGQCVDGVCCNAACDGQCEACDVAGSEGTCSAVTGAPRGEREACTGAGSPCGGSCNGVDRAACEYPQTECRAASCTEKTKTVAATCQDGVCPAEQTVQCAIECAADDCLTVTQIAAGYNNTCALMSDKTVRCWGDRGYGILAGGDPEPPKVPTPIAGVSGVKQLTSAGAHTCALLENGTAQCWGSNIDGELGRGTTGVYDLTPSAVRDETGNGSLTDITSISAGYLRTCATVTRGAQSEARCWGNNSGGALGIGTTSTRTLLPSPVCQTGSAGACSRLTGVSQLAAGNTHTCAVVSGANLYCWGGNSWGQLARRVGSAFVKDDAAHPNPEQVRDPNNPAVALSVDSVALSIGTGGASTCAIRQSDKTLLCWGSNYKGVLGRSSFEDPLLGQETPSGVCTTVAGCPPLIASAAGTSGAHACAISVDKVRCWGLNESGQLGDGTKFDANFPSLDVAAAALVSGLAVGEYHTCALLVDGSVQCWGHRLGLGNNATQDSPSPVSPTW